MPNDLTTKRNLLDAREDLRLESRRKLASSGFTASTWTLSGVVLVACGGAGEITDALCPNFDAAVLVSCGGGGGPNVQSSQGESHFVQSSPVRGARLYFDTNNDKRITDEDMLRIAEEDMRTQDGQYPEGFTTDATGEAENIPEHLFGKPFVAILDGAFNADTDAPLSGVMFSIPDYSTPEATGQHTIATPITDWIAGQAGFKEPQVRTSSQVRDAVNDVIANFLGHEAYSTLAGDELTAFNLLYAEILNPASYAGNPIIESLSAYLATNPSLINVRENALNLINDAQPLIVALMEADPAVLANLPDTLIVLHVDDDTNTENMIDLPDVTIGTNAAAAGAYIATVYAVSADGVRYSIVESDGTTPDPDSAFNVDSQGVVSLTRALDAGTTEIYVQVTNAGRTQTETVKIDVTVQSVTTLTPPTTSGPIEIAENTLGSDASPVVTGIEVSGTANPDADNFIISDAPDSPPGYAAMFDIVQDGTTWNLVLRDTESLDYEAIDNLRLRDTQALDEQAIVRGAIKLNVRYQTTNTNDPNNPLFSDPLEFTIMVTDAPDITFSGDFGGVVTEDADEDADADADADEDADADADADSLVATGSITVNNHDGADVSVTDSGTYGTLALNDDDTWTYTLNNAHADVQSLRAGEILVDTATISVASTPTATTKNIHITILGANEDVGDGDGTAMDIEIGDLTADLGNVLTNFGVNLDVATTTVAFADSVSADLRALFDLSTSGALTFTGNNAAAVELGIGAIELAMIASAPQFTTADIPPFTVQVNVVNDEDNGDAEYEIDENQAGTELSVALIDADPNSADYSEDPDGVDADSVMYQWFTIGGASNSTTKTNIGTPTTSATLDISSHTLQIGASYGVTVTYQDGSGTDESVDVLYPSVYFFNHPQDAIMVNENDATSVAPTNLPTVQAMGGGGAAISYRFTSDGDGGGKFAINSNTGVITLAAGQTLDFESGTTSYTLTIIAEDANESANTATISIDVIDLNDETPTYMTDGTASVETMPNGNDTNQMTGYSIIISDADATNTFSVSVSDDRFEFQRDGTTNTWNLVLLKDEAVTEAAGTNIMLTYTVSDDANNEAAKTTNQPNAVTVSVIMGNTPQSPAIIPDRQSFAHQDSYDPDDLGLTPMPDADPQAG